MTTNPLKKLIASAILLTTSTICITYLFYGFVFVKDFIRNMEGSPLIGIGLIYLAFLLINSARKIVLKISPNWPKFIQKEATYIPPTWDIVGMLVYGKYLQALFTITLVQLAGYFIVGIAK